MYVKSGEQTGMRYKEWRARQRQRPQAPPPPGNTSGDPWWTRPDNPQPGDPWWTRRDEWRHRRRSRRGQCFPFSHPKLFFAIFLICAGAVLFFENVGLIAVRNIWAYWPLILVAMGVSRLANDNRSGKIQPRGLILIIVGIAFLANNLGFFFMAADFAWPILLIIFGGFLLVKTLESHRRPQAFAFAAGPQRTEPPGSEHTLKEQVYFGNLKRTISSQDFRGGEAISVFGEINIDLRHAQIAVKETSIEANATFGAINIRVPETWRVSVRGAGIFGGYEDKTLPPRPAPGFNPPLLIINGAAVFGAVVVKN
jgi:predicted membrane protein